MVLTNEKLTREKLSSALLNQALAAAKQTVEKNNYDLGIPALPKWGGRVPSRQAIALISEHGDPAAEIGKEAAGGQNVYVRQVGEALAKLGWQVDMFTRKVHPQDATIVEHSPHCRTIRLQAGPEEFIPRDELFPYMSEFVQSLREFQVKSGIHYPLIHTNYWMSAWVALQLRKQTNFQLVHTYHSLGAVKYQATDQRPKIAATRLRVEREILEQAECVVATSPQEKDCLRQLVSKQGHIEIIPCGTDLSTFHPQPKPEARAKLGFVPTAPLVLYVGRFDQRKGIETFVRSCAPLRNSTTLDDLQIVIVGGAESGQADDLEQQRITQLVEDLGLKECVHFAGQIGHDRLPLYYAAADVCVIPSHYEPFGLVALEAMACCTPVVASDVGGLKFSVVSEETGLLVPPQDVVAFSQAINRILSDEVWAHKLRRQSALRVQQNFSWSGVAGQLSDLYRRLLAQSLTRKPLWSSENVIAS
jgi:glycosyltransferase involved in cell wall biosynthesis